MQLPRQYKQSINPSSYFMEKKIRVLVAFYGLVVLVMMASKKSENGKNTINRTPETRVAAWDRMAR